MSQNGLLKKIGKTALKWTLPALFVIYNSSCGPKYNGPDEKLGESFKQGGCCGSFNWHYQEKYRINNKIITIEIYNKEVSYHETEEDQNNFKVDGFSEGFVLSEQSKDKLVKYSFGSNSTLKGFSVKSKDFNESFNLDYLPEDIAHNINSVGNYYLNKIDSIKKDILKKSIKKFYQEKKLKEEKRIQKLTEIFELK